MTSHGAFPRKVSSVVARAFPALLLANALGAVGFVVFAIATKGLKTQGWVLGTAIGLSSLAVGLAFWSSSLLRQQLPSPWNVAIIGFPQSGKTTLIVSLFGEMFARRLDYMIAPQGTSTIERVNEGLRALREGRPVGPTKAQDRFSFRADIAVGSFIRRKAYKVEFGDFPGDDSRLYSAEHGEWLHNTEFFRWAQESDAIVFAIDLAKYCIDGRTYVNLMSSAIRAAWQEFASQNPHQARPLRRVPLILAFTKADVLQYARPPLLPEESGRLGSAPELMTEMGFGVPPHECVLSAEDVGSSLKTVLLDFADLIAYLTSESERFRVVAVSSFGRGNDGILLGFNELITSILPSY